MHCFNSHYSFAILLHTRNVVSCMPLQPSSSLQPGTKGFTRVSKMNYWLTSAWMMVLNQTLAHIKNSPFLTF